ncbi:MAG: glycoside hydrolase family 92 protein [Myxococcales bacterium]|nr:glycoside hydrolase family 92 protein [Myxococcales bacterium]
MPERRVRAQTGYHAGMCVSSDLRRVMRRTRLLPGTLAAIATLAACSAGPDAAPDAAPSPLPPVTDPIPYVDPIIGAGGFGFAAGSAFPGAAAPNGLVKVGPDTKGPVFGELSFIHYAGYWAGDDTVLRFTHLHLHGTGLTDYGVLGVMPVGAFDPTRPRSRDYPSRFRKETEHATPGRYRVTLDETGAGVDVDLVATPHGAHHRYTFADAAAPRTIVVDLAAHLHEGTIPDAELELEGTTGTLHGRLRSIGQMTGGFGGYDVFFAARAKTPWQSAQVFSDAAPPAAGNRASGTGVGCALVFAPGADPVELAVGVSIVSAEGAARHLAEELDGNEHDALAAATEAAWRARLSTVLVEGGNARERRILYSSLYKAFLMPSVTSDSDGAWTYAGQVGRTDGWRFVSDLSLWDTYRTLHPLYSLLAPDLARDSVRSLHQMAVASGRFPKWPLATGDSGSMLGASAEIVIADAYLKGVTDFDAPATYALLRAAALGETEPPGGRGARDQVVSYNALGYVPVESGSSVSMTTEYAQNDFALGEFARALGETDDAELLHARSRNWKNLFDPDAGFLRGRFADGGWNGAARDFDPQLFSEDYVEANAWQSLWMITDDVDGLAELLGGEAALVAKLEAFFVGAAEDLLRAPIDNLGASSAPRPYYWHGNEPDIHAASLFAMAGRPDLAADWTRWIMDELYSDGPAGLPGNDDGGTMSAWWVFAAIGLYPIVGSDRYVLVAPRFPKATLAVTGGTFTILAEGISAERRYVREVRLNGMPWTTSELVHAQLAPGGVLEYIMSTTP